VTRRNLIADRELDDTTRLILLLPVLLFSVVAHEYAHGYAALKQGDPTAYQLGRLTFNPIKHIDPIMTIILPIVMFMSTGMMFGGAKPVPVNPRNYRNFKKGDIIVSMAGIATNIVLALICAALIVPLGLFGAAMEAASGTIGTIQMMLVMGIQINFLLAIFNLLPVPPLDGSHVMKYILPPAWALQYSAIGGAGFFILIAIMLFIPGLLFLWMTPAREATEFLYLFVQPYMRPYDFP
jgi:Zn-dependent protease